MEYPVKELLHYKNKIGGIISNKENIFADAVIVATGGASYPQTGSEGDGYRFARQTGHKVTPLYPALVPLEIKESTKELSGLKLKNVELSAYKNNEKLAEVFGEFYFTNFGLDGSSALRLSSKIKEEIKCEPLS